MRKSIPLLLCVFAIACNKAEGKTSPAPKPSATIAETTTAAPSASPPPTAEEAKTVELRVSANGSAMAFEPTTLTVPAGSTVHLVFEDKKPGVLLHNWALVMPGTEAKVAAEGLAKGEVENYVAEGPNMLAYTPLAKPGTTQEVTFKAPPPGTYPYICTYPGHYVMMKGTLTVTP